MVASGVEGPELGVGGRVGGGRGLGLVGGGRSEPDVRGAFGIVSIGGADLVDNRRRRGSRQHQGRDGFFFNFYLLIYINMR